MDDPILANAIVRRDAAAAELARWDEFIRLYGELKRTQPPVPVAIAHAAQALPPVTQVAAANIVPKRTPRASTAVDETEALAARILRRAGHPLSTKMILAQMHEDGFAVPGTDPAKTLSTRLYRASALVHRPGFGWWFVEPAQEDRAATPTSVEDEAAALVPETPNDADTARGGGI